MSSVLRRPIVEQHAHRIGVQSVRSLDPTTQGLVAIAADEAHRRGMADGRAAALAEIEEARTAAADALRDALAAAQETLRASRDVTLTEVVDFAFEIAVLMCGSIDHDHRDALVARVTEALDLIDDAPLALLVHPGEVEEIAAALGNKLAVEADASLAPGEAIISGPWSRAELTREALRSAIRESLA